MAKREIQEINAGSMADIAFLLLIFFLVTTTMDTDSGIVRKLPPMPEENTQQDDVQIKERNIFVVLVNRDNQLLVEGELMNIKDLREATKEFIINPTDDPDLPAKEIKEFPIVGPMEVTAKHVISLRNDRGTSYETYIAVQNELAAAYNELRDEYSLRKWGKKFDDLEADLQEVVEDIYPMKISEAEPKNVGG
ncbi:MAG: biopolymer transporter ExbD [Bacteroidales bacterium]|nr:biopolymer transporter ExbD [Bacteroidales bacterium]MBN2821464.1 biopolymer transporter ExbD [Bacteroidales bacterium]